MKLALALDRNDLSKLQGIILVELWNKVTTSGNLLRQYVNEFDVKDRDIINRYYLLFKKWHFESGFPEKHTMSIKEYQLIHKAVQFFVSIT